MFNGGSRKKPNDAASVGGRCGMEDASYGKVIQSFQNALFILSTSAEIISLLCQALYQTLLLFICILLNF